MLGSLTRSLPSSTRSSKSTAGAKEENYRVSESMDKGCGVWFEPAQAAERFKQILRSDVFRGAFDEGKGIGLELPVSALLPPKSRRRLLPAKILSAFAGASARIRRILGRGSRRRYVVRPTPYRRALARPCKRMHAYYKIDCTVIHYSVLFYASHVAQEPHGLRWPLVPHQSPHPRR